MPRYVRDATWAIVALGMLVSCASTDPLMRPVTVLTPQEHLAQHTIATAESVAGSLTRFFIDGHRTRTIPTEAVDAYLQDINPALQISIDNTREMLRQTREQPTKTRLDKLQAQTQKLANALENATFLAQKFGW